MNGPRSRDRDQPQRYPVSMHGLEPVTVQCPFCGEAIELLIDCSVEEQEYIEDCEVCCHPMTVNATIVDGEPRVWTSR